MRLTTKGRFAVTAMMDLAMRGDEGAVQPALPQRGDGRRIAPAEQRGGDARRRGLGRGFQLGAHAAGAEHASIAGHREQRRRDRVDAFDRPRGGIVQRMPAVQAGDVGGDQQQVGLHQRGNRGGQVVVVAQLEPELVSESLFLIVVDKEEASQARVGLTPGRSVWMRVVPVHASSIANLEAVFVFPALRHRQLWPPVSLSIHQQTMPMDDGGLRQAVGERGLYNLPFFCQ